MLDSPRGRRWRTIRQRRERARSGQVAPVAVMLGLLLLTSFIANFVLLQQPGEMDQNEFQHTLLVENQLARLQSTVLTQAQNPNLPIAELLPVTLGSAGAPPFVGPSDGEITQETSSALTNFNYTLARIVPNPPDWAATPGCPPTGHPCNNGTAWDNVTGIPGNNYTFKLNGAAPSFLLNFSGNKDTVGVEWAGHSVGVTYIILNGSNLTLNLDKLSNGGSGSPRILIWVYGQHDVVTTALNGQIVTMQVEFFGSVDQPCPQGNLAATDRFYWNTSAGSGATVNVTWLNDLGFSTPAHVIGLAPGTLTFHNETSYAGGCAFTLSYPSQYTSPFSSGLRVHLNNQYLPPADLAYDQGAVILSHPGIGSIMVSPPKFEFQRTAAGWTGNLVLVDVPGTPFSEGGTETAGIVSRLVSVQHFELQSNATDSIYFISSALNLTTAYPGAWASYFQSLPVAVTGGEVVCTPPYAFTAPYSCLTPPAGVSVTLLVPLHLIVLSVTLVTVELSLA
ncbi:MAG: hypothetical protein ACYDFT_05240 [Thermoplasmata archaeon]